MGDRAETKKSGTQTATGGVAEFLAAPKKKRKNHVVLALSESFSQDIRRTIQKYLAEFSKNFILVEVSSPEELVRQLQRHIHLLVLDDTFADLPRLMQLVRFMKEKKQSDGIPVLFLTRESSALVTAYRETLLAYQENDDHLILKGVKPVEIVARLKQALETRNRRRSRRFKVGSKIMYQHLGSETWKEATLVDISIHGAAINASDADLFLQKAQLRIQIPLLDVLTPGKGEIFKLSCMVRRVSIGGSAAGLSFEHITERQLSILTDIVTAIAAKSTMDSEIDNRTC